MRNSNELKTNTLSGREIRSLYCATDAAITRDIWTIFSKYRNDTYEKTRKLFLKSLESFNGISFDNGKIRKFCKNASEKGSASQHSVELGLLKPSETFQSYKLEKIINQGKNPEDRIAAKTLLDNYLNQKLAKSMTSLLDSKFRFVPFIVDFQIQLRGSGTSSSGFYLDDMEQLTPFIRNHFEMKTVSAADVWKIDTSSFTDIERQLMEYWLYSFTPLKTSRHVRMNSDEIVEIFRTWNEKYRERIETIEEMYLNLYTSSHVSNSLTNTRWSAPRELDEETFVKLVNNEAILHKICEIVNNCTSSKFLINNNKLVLIYD